MVAVGSSLLLHLLLDLGTQGTNLVVLLSLTQPDSMQSLSGEGRSSCGAPPTQKAAMVSKRDREGKGRGGDV